jgi:hypothetical protein
VTRAGGVDARVTRLGLLLLLLGACTDPMHPRTYPRWVIDTTNAADPDGGPAVQWRDCAGLRPYVRKSGKAGIGVTLEIRSRTDCAATITRAEIVFPEGAPAAATIPAVPELRGRSLRYLWMPVHFDGDTLWNRGVRRATLQVEVAIDGVAQPQIDWPVVELWTGPYLE